MGPDHCEYQYTKRDAFVLTGCDSPEYTHTPQRVAAFILMRNSDFSRSFIQEWLDYVQDPRIVTDCENQLGLENYPGFIENRHDQTVLSLLVKKHKLPTLRGHTHRNPARPPHKDYLHVIAHTRDYCHPLWLRLLLRWPRLLRRWYRQHGISFTARLAYKKRKSIR